MTACMTRAIEKSLSFSLSEPLLASSDQEDIKETLTKKYQAHIKAIEQQMFKQIRTLFKHNLFEVYLPEYSILKHDLFSKQTWELLGLTTEQLVATGAIIGGTMGAVIDTAAAGITFGVFTAIGGILGAGSALFSGKKITKKKTAGIRFGGDKLQLGPNKNPQFLYILMDRALIYYSHIINRPHGRRDLQDPSKNTQNKKKGYSTEFTAGQRNVCAKFFKAVNGRTFLKEKTAMSDFEDLINAILNEISHQ